MVLRHLNPHFRITAGKPAAGPMIAAIVIVVAIMASAPALLAQDTHSADAPATGDAMDSMTLDTAPFRQAIAIACDFANECVEDEPCTEVQFTPEITGMAGGLSANDLVLQTQMITDAETIELLGVKSANALSLSGGTFAARHLLSISQTGAARYTVHYADGPFVISYLGTCN